MSAFHYSIASFLIAVRLPDEVDPHRLLSAFEPFLCKDSEAAHSPILTFHAGTQNIPIPTDASLLDETTSDLGTVSLYQHPQGWTITLRDHSHTLHVMQAHPDFTRVQAVLDFSSPHAAAALSSLLRIAFSQAILPHYAISLHASAVVAGGSAFLFMGASGTGKSTHSRLWIDSIPATHLLNDDNPIVVIDHAHGTITAHGSPWSGKTPCYRRESAPLMGIARLQQAPANRFLPRTDTDAFITLLPGCSVIKASPALHNHLCNTLALISAATPIGILQCLPDPTAARLCHQSLTNVQIRIPNPSNAHSLRTTTQ